MPEQGAVNKKNMKICLLGASFDTGNMGVSVLAESSIKVILNKWPDAEIVLLGSGYAPQEYHLSILSKEICVRTLPIRFCKNIFLPYHFLKFVFYGLLLKILPGLRMREYVANRNKYFRLLFETDFVADITGGDSFSDIYGFRRFFLVFLCRWLVISLGKKLVLLPQTYGPFKGLLTQKMARYVLKHANLIYSRDRAGIEYLKNVLNIDSNSGKVRFAPDVAFVLDSRKPDDFDATLLTKAKNGNTTLVGLNISGLLFNGGYTKDNMFNLKSDYRELVFQLIKHLMQNEKVVILLVSHVFPPAELSVESDLEACRKVFAELREIYPGRLFCVEGQYDQSEVKYVIGVCDFFIGSRMHACIAALSQGIPAVGIAYSRKFSGVFESIGLNDCVVDARSCEERETLEKLVSLFKRREQISKHLLDVMPEVRAKVLDIFEYLNCE
jgi:polysaccharide pyruvyl transferase WcaK-like protein